MSHFAAKNEQHCHLIVYKKNKKRNKKMQLIGNEKV